MKTLFLSLILMFSTLAGPCLASDAATLPPRVIVIKQQGTFYVPWREDMTFGSALGATGGLDTFDRGPFFLIRNGVSTRIAEKTLISDQPIQLKPWDIIVVATKQWHAPTPK